MQVREAGGSEVRENVHVSAAEQQELPDSKGTANFIMKFDKGSKSTASVGHGRILVIMGVFSLPT